MLNHLSDNVQHFCTSPWLYWYFKFVLTTTPLATFDRLGGILNLHITCY